jgi:hypothetical protein
MIKDRGIEAIINDNLIGTVVTMGKSYILIYKLYNTVKN